MGGGGGGSSDPITGKWAHFLHLLGGGLVIRSNTRKLRKWLRDTFENTKQPRFGSHEYAKTAR